MTDASGNEISMMQWFIGIIGAMISMFTGWLHIRQTSETRDRKENETAIWAQINQVNRDWRDLFTKEEAMAMEQRITDAIYRHQNDEHRDSRRGG